MKLKKRLSNLWALSAIEIPSQYEIPLSIKKEIEKGKTLAKIINMRDPVKEILKNDA